MRIKNLFTVPTGQKVTERHLRRVLISSICSILLCMACLVSTTWAWFAVSIENTGNVIEIATVTADVTLKDGENEVVKSDNGGYSLAAGTYSITIQLKSDAAGSDLLDDPQSPVYVLMNGKTACYYFVFEGGLTEATKEITISISSALEIVSFSVSWIKPVSATLIGDEAVVIGETPTELIETSAPAPTAAPKESTPPTTTEPADAPEETTPPPTTEPSTIPEDTTTPAATEPSTESTTTEG